MLTLLTPTGCRPEAWALCERWMARQTYTGQVRWIVVDDGSEPQPVTFERDGWSLEVIRPAHRWRRGENTQAPNFRAGLELVGRDDRVVVIEDDDWYSPEWLQVAAEGLEAAELVGQCRNRYFNVRTGATIEHTNERHASLCATAFRGAALEDFREIAKRGPRLMDMPLWRSFQGTKRVIFGDYVIGMKGLPGRGGIAGGHDMTTDTPFDLRQWIGADAAHYQEFMR